MCFIKNDFNLNNLVNKIFLNFINTKIFINKIYILK